ncbi:MAG TPA: ECF-type sigma factor [Bryobacteraceae bacterium]|nr:ECF-type sigma factor [Bryobacteraceae bacterium]
MLPCYNKVAMDQGEVTALLRAWGSGDRSVGDQLFRSIYKELHTLAQYHLRGRPEATVSPTMLINEAFLQLAAEPKSDWRDRVQFFAFTATVMRRLMIGYARRRGAEKRGGGFESIVFDESIHALLNRGIDVEALDEALNALDRLDSTQARIVELRFFGGLSVEDTAEHLNMSPRSVIRHWGLAKAWLADHLAN